VANAPLVLIFDSDSRHRQLPETASVFLLFERVFFVFLPYFLQESNWINPVWVILTWTSQNQARFLSKISQIPQIKSFQSAKSLIFFLLTVQEFH
jgi:hypothetical protein